MLRVRRAPRRCLPPPGRIVTGAPPPRAIYDLSNPYYEPPAPRYTQPRTAKGRLLVGVCFHSSYYDEVPL